MASSGTIGKINAGGNDYLVASTAFATCSTAADTAAKVATIQDGANFTLIAGITIHVYFNNGNTADSPTLNVNNTGAKDIYGPKKWFGGATVTFTYYNDKWYYQGLNEIVPLSKGGTGIEAGGNNINWYTDNTLHPHLEVSMNPLNASFYVFYRGPLDNITSISDFYNSDYWKMTMKSIVPMVIMGSYAPMGEAIIWTGLVAEGDISKIYILFPDAVLFNGIYVNGLKGELVYDSNDGIYMNPSTMISLQPTWVSATVQGATLDGNNIVSDGIAQLTTGTSSGTLAAGDHTHGNITNGGDITTNVTIASGDRLVINDESASKINNSSITFGTSTTQFLANNGTWQTPATGGGVDSTDTSNKIFLIGAETQGTGVSTYSDNQVYATDGQLDANKVRVAETATIQWNSTDSSLDFIFS